MPDMTPTLGDVTRVSFRIVVRTQHLVIDRLWSRVRTGDDWGEPFHTGHTAGDDEDATAAQAVQKGSEVVLQLMVQTVNVAASGNFNFEITVVDPRATVLRGGRTVESGPMDASGITLFERRVTFQGWAAPGRALPQVSGRCSSPWRPPPRH